MFAFYHRNLFGTDANIQYHFLPIAVSYDSTNAAKKHSFQVHVGPMRSKSRGSIRLQSADSSKAPLISFNYMDKPKKQ